MDDSVRVFSSECCTVTEYAVISLIWKINYAINPC